MGAVSVRLPPPPAYGSRGCPLALARAVMFQRVADEAPSAPMSSTATAFLEVASARVASAACAPGSTGPCRAAATMSKRKKAQKTENFRIPGNP